MTHLNLVHNINKTVWFYDYDNGCCRNGELIGMHDNEQETFAHIVFVDGDNGPTLCEISAEYVFKTEQECREFANNYSLKDNSYSIEE